MGGSSGIRPSAPIGAGWGYCIFASRSLNFIQEAIDVDIATTMGTESFCSKNDSNAVAAVHNMSKLSHIKFHRAHAGPRGGFALHEIATSRPEQGFSRLMPTRGHNPICPCNPHPKRMPLNNNPPSAPRLVFFGMAPSEVRHRSLPVRSSFGSGKDLDIFFSPLSPARNILLHVTRREFTLTASSPALNFYLVL